MVKSCINPDFRHQLTVDLAIQRARGENVVLSPQAMSHIYHCPTCVNEIGLWLRAAESTFREVLVNSIIRLAEMNDESVFRKQVPNGIALFRLMPNENQRGLIVVMDSPEHVLAQDEMTLDEFRVWNGF